MAHTKDINKTLTNTIVLDKSEISIRYFILMLLTRMQTPLIHIAAFIMFSPPYE